MTDQLLVYTYLILHHLIDWSHVLTLVLPGSIYRDAILLFVKVISRCIHFLVDECQSRIEVALNASTPMELRWFLMATTSSAVPSSFIIIGPKVEVVSVVWMSKHQWLSQQ